MSEKSVFVFASKRLGMGPEELGDLLIRGFFRTLATTEPFPQVLVFVNTGVELLTVPEINESLAALTAKGVKVLACGTCIDYFQLRDQVKSEYLSNMGEIVSTLATATKVVNL